MQLRATRRLFKDSNYRRCTSRANNYRPQSLPPFPTLGPPESYHRCLVPSTLWNCPPSFSRVETVIMSTNILAATLGERIKLLFSRSAALPLLSMDTMCRAINCKVEGGQCELSAAVIVR